MAMPRVFVSFDFDHDSELRDLFVGQSRNPRTPFTLANWSVKEAMSGDWKGKVRPRIRSVDVVLAICGEHTDTATGVSAEVRIAREEGKPVYFLKGRKDKTCRLPKSALPEDRILDWTWENLEAILSKPASPLETDPMPLGDALLLAGTVIGGTVVAKEAWQALTSKPPKRRSYTRTSQLTPHA